MTTPTVAPAGWPAQRVGQANYPGDVAARILADPIKGPVASGELVTAYEAVYDPEADKTVVQFRYTTTDDLPADEIEMLR